MAKEKILLIDDDVNFLKLLRKLLDKAGYHLTCAVDAEQALEKLERCIPDLIVLDLMLPQKDGYTFLEEIKAKPEWAAIPVIILSALSEQRDKLRGLRLGVMDYITKPFDHEEFLARVRNVLDFYKLKFKKTAPKKQSGRQKLLNYMKTHGIQTLMPRARRDAKLGYEYPEAAAILVPEEPGGEIFHLESMAKAKKLDRIFYDAIHLCPECGHHDLNFREICPHCEYADIEQKRLITHKSCGFRGSIEVFPNGELDNCPCCGDPFGEKGVGYEISTSSLLFCRGCNEEFSEALVNCRCMNCDKIIEIASVLVRKIYAYKLLSDNLHSDIDQPPRASAPGHADASYLPDLNYVEFHQFTRQLDRELQFASQLQGSVSLLKLTLTPSAAAGESGTPAGREIKFSNLLHKILRYYDILSRPEPNVYLVLLSETPRSMAKILANALQEEFERHFFDNRLELNIVSFPEDGQTCAELLASLKIQPEVHSAST